MITKRPKRLSTSIPVVLALFLLVGCYRGNETDGTSGPHGIHGGHVVGLPADAGFQVEFTLDEKRPRMVLYIQQLGTQEPHPLAVETIDARFEASGNGFDATFTADPRGDDPRGSSSRFALSLDELPQQLISANQFLLELSFLLDEDRVVARMPHANDHAHKYHHD